MGHQRSALYARIGMKLGYIREETLPALSPDAEATLPEDFDRQLLDNGEITLDQHSTIASLVDKALEEGGDDMERFLESLDASHAMPTLQTGPDLHDSATVHTDQDAGASATVQTGPGIHESATIRTDQDLHDSATVQSSPALDSSSAQTVVTEDNADPNATRLDPRAGGAMLDDIPGVTEHQGRYTLIKDVKKGGMGAISLVNDKHLGRDIAFKTLLPDRIKSATRMGSLPTASLLTVPIIARFLQEARVNAQLEHPSIVPIYELGFRADGTLYYTMKFVRGRDMQDALKDCQTLEDRLKLLTHFMDVCNAIAYAHSRGVIHRDLKPLNLMIGEFGETVLIDWGIAKVKGAQDIHARQMNEQTRSLRMLDTESTAKTMEGQTIGSPFYMPPEQAAGKVDEVDERSDIYALGAILYTILSGQPPYKGLNVHQFLERVITFDPKPILEIEPTAPPELVAIAEHAMRRKQEDRYQNAKEIANEIQQFIAGGLVGAYKYTFGELLRRWMKKHAKILATAAAALLLLIVLGVYSYVRITQERNEAVRQQQIAEEERAAAETAREAEEAQRREAELQRATAERELYKSNVQLANVSIEQRLMAEARSLLEDAPREHWQWEWGYLQQQAHADLQTIKAGGRFAAYADNGTLLVTGSPNGTVGVFDAQTLERRHTLIERAGAQAEMDVASLAPRVAVGGDAAIQVFDAGSAEVLFSFTEPDPRRQTHGVSISDDGSILAGYCSDRVVRVWRVLDGMPIHELPQEPGTAPMLSLSPLGDLLLFGHGRENENFYRVTLTDVATGRVVGTGQVPFPLTMKAAAFSRDSRYFAFGTDESLELWSTRPMRQLHRIDARFATPDTIAFSSDGVWLAAGTRDGGVGVWSVEGGVGRILQNAHAENVRAVAFTPDNASVVTGSFDRSVKQWSVPEVRHLRTLRGHDVSVFTVAVSPDGRRLISGSQDNTTKVWDLQDEVNAVQMSSAAFSPGQKLLAGITRENVGVWNTTVGHRIATLAVPNGRAVAIAESAPMVAVVVHDQTATSVPRLILWNHETNETREAEFEGAVPDQVLISPTGRYGGVKVGSTVALVDTVSSTLIRLDRVANAKFSPGGELLALSRTQAEGTGLEISLLTLETDVETEPHVVPGATSSRLAFAPDGQTLYVGTQELPSSGSVYVVPVSGTPATRWEAETLVESLAVSADGERLIAGSRGSSIGVWNTRTGTREVLIEHGHADAVSALAFTPDGERFGSASIDGTFKLWRTATGEQLLLLSSVSRGAGRVVAPADLAFSEDGRVLFTLTVPEAVPPLISRAMPWDDTASPGEVSAETDGAGAAATAEAEAP